MNKQHKKKRLVFILCILLAVVLLTAGGFFARQMFRYRPLEQGCIGADVSNVQQRLRALHFFYEPITAVYDEETIAAVKRFQSANGLEPTGILTREEQRLLLNGNSQSSGFSVTFLDVGQADAILIECDEHAALVDGGSRGDSQLIYTVLEQRGIDVLDAVFCTHPHEDHVGGLSAAFQNATVKAAYCCTNIGDSKAFDNYVKKIDESGLTLQIPAPGTTIPVGSARITVLGPLNENSDVNNMSLILRVDYGNTSILLMGDAEMTEEETLLAANANLRADVLKVGHHGSEAGSGEAFLNAVGAETAVISVGTKNSYGHPAAQTLDRLAAAGMTIFRTDTAGDITCISDGKTLRFLTEREPQNVKTSAPSEKKPTEKPIEKPTTKPVVRNTDREKTEDFVIPKGTTYALNTLRRKIHSPDCASVAQTAPENRAFTDKTLEELLADEYTICGSCKAGTASEKSDATDTPQKPTSTPATTQTVNIPEGTTYVLNTNSRVFHRKDCGSVEKMSEKNRAFTTKSLDELLAEKYKPCGACKPDANPAE